VGIALRLISSAMSCFWWDAISSRRGGIDEDGACWVTGTCDGSTSTTSSASEVRMGEGIIERVGTAVCGGAVYSDEDATEGPRDRLGVADDGTMLGERYCAAGKTGGLVSAENGWDCRGWM